MDQNLALLGGLCIGIAMVVRFLMFASNIGALAAFGRYALSWRKIGLLTLGAGVHVTSMLLAMSVCEVKALLAHPAFLACAMAFMGWICVFILGRLEAWALIEPKSV